MSSHFSLHLVFTHVNGRWTLNLAAAPAILMNYPFFKGCIYLPMVTSFALVNILSNENKLLSYPASQEEWLCLGIQHFSSLFQDQRYLIVWSSHLDPTSHFHVMFVFFSWLLWQVWFSAPDKISCEKAVSLFNVQKYLVWCMLLCLLSDTSNILISLCGDDRDRFRKAEHPFTALLNFPPWPL